MFTIDIPEVEESHSSRSDAFSLTLLEPRDGITVGSRDDFAAQIIPAWFQQGLDDCLEGRVVDMEIALNEPPPERE